MISYKPILNKFIFYGHRIWLLATMIVLSGGLLLGCEEAVVYIVTPPVEPEVAQVIPPENNLSKDNKDDPIPEKVTSNCTIREYLSSRVKTDRFYCQVKNQQLYIYPSVEKNHIGQIDPTQQIYTLNNPSSQTMAIRGRVSVNNQQWEFVPYKTSFMIGPSRVQVVLD